MEQARPGDEMTDEQKQFCIKVAGWMDRIKTFPGGAAFLTDLLLAVGSGEGLTVVDEHDPRQSIRREITQELYDAVWIARELRKGGYTMQTASKIADHVRDGYAAHGTQYLVRYLDLTTDAALHNAGLEGFKPSGTRTGLN